MFDDKYMDETDKECEYEIFLFLIWKNNKGEKQK